MEIDGDDARQIHHWRYVDDRAIQAPAGSVVKLLGALDSALAAFGLLLQRATCAFTVLASRGVGEADWTASAQTLAQRTRHYDTVVLTGTEACRDRAMPLDAPADSISHHTQVRLERAERLAQRTLEMLSFAPPSGAKQPAFAIARCVPATRTSRRSASLAHCCSNGGRDRAPSQRRRHAPAPRAERRDAGHHPVLDAPIVPRSPADGDRPAPPADLAPLGC